METKKTFQKYRARLVFIGIVKALICGLIIGLAVDFVIAFITWFTVSPSGGESHKALWLVLGLSVGIGLAVAVVCATVFYFRFFKPNTKNIARIVDRLGLEERAITMYELENDESYIAMRQREDAQARLQAVSPKSLKFAIPKLAIILLAVLGVFGVGMTTVTALSAEDIVKGGVGFVEGLVPEPDVFVEVNYMVWQGGYIEGEPMQIIKRGANTEPVLAIADDGWVFLQWAEDGYASAERMDYKVMGEETSSGGYVFTRTAYFVPLQESDNENENQNDNNQDQDQPDDQPSDPKDDEWQSPQIDQSGEGDDEPDDGSEPPPPGALPSQDNNYIIDGQTDYREEFDYDSKMEELQGNNDIPDWLKDIIGGYYGSL